MRNGRDRFSPPAKRTTTHLKSRSLYAHAQLTTADNAAHLRAPHRAQRRLCAVARTAGGATRARREPTTFEYEYAVAVAVPVLCADVLTDGDTNPGANAVPVLHANIDAYHVTTPDPGPYPGPDPGPNPGPNPDADHRAHPGANALSDAVSVLPADSGAVPNTDPGAEQRADPGADPEPDHRAVPGSVSHA